MENINTLYKNTRYCLIYVGYKRNLIIIFKEENLKIFLFPSIIKYYFFFFHSTVWRDLNLECIFCRQPGCFPFCEKWKLMIY